METRYIKIDYGKALSTKKQLLTSELNILHLIKLSNTYKFLRKKELVLKNKLKNSVSSLKMKINLLQSTFPEYEKRIIPKKIRATKGRKSQELQRELEEIKEKLARLE